jgi:hypothetical protein
MNDNNIISLIKQTKWKSFEKLYPIIKQKYPKITSKHLKYLIDNNITHDIKTPIKQNSKFNNKIVSNHRHSYQMDIFVNRNTKNNTNKNSSSTIYSYYLILININTRYVELYHLQNRSSTSLLNALKSIFNKLSTIKSLESDEEKSFVSSDVLSYLTQHKVDYYVITEQQHQSLGIIDRFIRTMRDYLKKNEPADDSKIKRFVYAYNNTIHNETGLSPQQIQNDKQLEIEYIIHKLSEQANVENKPGYKVDVGDKVRLIENKHTMKKTRYNVTPFYFVISDINCKSIIISATD